MTAETKRILDNNKAIRKELAETTMNIAVIHRAIDVLQEEIDKGLKEMDDMFAELGIESEPSSKSTEEALKDIDDMFAELGI